MQLDVRCGTAGWAIPVAASNEFPCAGSSLERYAARFNTAEINSTFYRRHHPATLERWARATPDDFRFAWKVSREITHAARLNIAPADWMAVQEDAGRLGHKLGPLLFQLPPSLAYDAVVVERFFNLVRSAFGGKIACEPRHTTWFEPEADEVLARYRIARVAADPLRHPLAGQPGGWPDFAYWRWHGSPRMYYSAYGNDRLAALAAALKVNGRDAFCIFDNTASGAAIHDALHLLQFVQS